MYDDDSHMVSCIVCMQVVSQYARTMFTLSTEAERLTATKENAAGTLKRVRFLRVQIPC